MDARALRIGISPWMPGVNPCVLQKPTEKCFKQSGIELETLLTVLRLIGYNWTLIQSRTPGCGSVKKTRNGSLEAYGLCDMLLHNEIDITGNTCGLSPERTSVFQHSLPVFSSQQVFVFRSLGSANTNYKFSTLAPFKSQVWLACMAIFVLCWFSRLLALASFRRLSILRAIERLFRLVDEATIVGLDKKEKGARTTMMMRTIWVFGIGYIFALYNSKITGIFVFNAEPDLPFQSVQQLAELVSRGDYVLTDYKQPIELPRTIHNITNAKFQAGVTRYGYKYVRQKVSTDIYNAILASKDNQYVLTHSDIWVQQDMVNFDRRGELSMFIDNEAGNYWYAYLWAKNFPHKEKLNRVMTGVLLLGHQIRQRYLGGKATVGEAKKEDSKFSPIALSQLTSIFETLMVSLAFCTGVMCMEVGLMCWTKHNTCAFLQQTFSRQRPPSKLYLSQSLGRVHFIKSWLG